MITLEELNIIYAEISDLRRQLAEAQKLSTSNWGQRERAEQAETELADEKIRYSIMDNKWSKEILEIQAELADEKALYKSLLEHHEVADEELAALREKGKGITFIEIQKFASDWSHKNFGDNYGSGYRNLLGVAEEVGELCHAQLKGEQGIKHTPDEILAMKKDAVGDIIMFLCNYCDSQKLNLEECVNIAREEIEKRDWRDSKQLMGESEAEIHG